MFTRARFLRKWNSSRFEGGVRYLYEPNFDATAKDYESWQPMQGCFANVFFNASLLWLIQVHFGVDCLPLLLRNGLGV